VHSKRGFNPHLFVLLLLVVVVVVLLLLLLLLLLRLQLLSQCLFVLHVLCMAFQSPYACCRTQASNTTSISCVHSLSLFTTVNDDGNDCFLFGPVLVGFEFKQFLSRPSLARTVPSLAVTAELPRWFDIGSSVLLPSLEWFVVENPSLSTALGLFNATFSKADATDRSPDVGVLLVVEAIETKPSIANVRCEDEAFFIATAARNRVRSVPLYFRSTGELSSGLGVLLPKRECAGEFLMVVRLLRGEHKSEMFSLLFLFGVLCLVLIVIMPAVDSSTAFDLL
jgi:hypothetical protein